MNPTEWLTANFAKLQSVAKLKRPRAKKLGALLSSGDYSAGNLTGLYADTDTGDEILVVDLEVGLGQRATVCDVRSREVVALRFGAGGTLPTAFSLRDDFPTDVPHLNVVPADQPRTFCLYNALPQEVLLNYTALRFIERIRWWLRETAYGRLHGDEQPLDPVFHPTGISFILPPDFFSQPQPAYVGVQASPRAFAPCLLHPINPKTLEGLPADENKAFAAISIVTPPILHGRMRNIPSSLQELIEAYATLGVDIATPLSEALAALTKVQGHKQLFCRPLLLLVSTPLKRDEGSGSEMTSIKAFIMPRRSSGSIAVSLGALYEAEGHWALPIQKPARGDLSFVSVFMADVYKSFDREIACEASGYLFEKKDPKIALVGSGAFGSQIAMAAARSGFGRWTIIDKDFLLPHNLARHALGGFHVAHAKADRVALEIYTMLGQGSADAIVADAIGPVDEEQKWPEVLESADIVIDASASVPVARWLSIDASRLASAASCFLNPKGSDAVILCEGNGRNPRLDELEMSYYWRLVNEASLADHLLDNDDVLSIGACRNPSARIGEPRIMSLAGLAADFFCRGSWPPAGQIIVWRASEGGIMRQVFSGEKYICGVIRDWTIIVREAVLAGLAEARTKAEECETGGILAGTWDRERKIAYVVGHFDPPPDSNHEPTGFVRGMVGVHRTIVQVENATMGHLTYSGEWHTHPPGHASTPSSDDRKLLRWVHDALQWSDAPATIVIAGDDGFRVVLLADGTQYGEFLIPPLK